MNTTLSAPPGRRRPPQPVTERVTRRVGLVDRLALRLGVALITWSRRPRGRSISVDRERLRRDAETALLLTSTRWRA